MDTCQEIPLFFTDIIYYHVTHFLSKPLEPDSGVYASANIIIAVPVGKRSHTFGVCRVFLSAENGALSLSVYGVCALTCLCIKGLFSI